MILCQSYSRLTGERQEPALYRPRSCPESHKTFPGRAGLGLAWHEPKVDIPYQSAFHLVGLREGSKGQTQPRLASGSGKGVLSLACFCFFLSDFGNGDSAANSAGQNNGRQQHFSSEMKGAKKGV